MKNIYNNLYPAAKHIQHQDRLQDTVILWLMPLIKLIEYRMVAHTRPGSSAGKGQAHGYNKDRGASNSHPGQWGMGLRM
jgi:hypothetical protein